MMCCEVLNPNKAECKQILGHLQLMTNLGIIGGEAYFLLNVSDRFEGWYCQMSGLGRNILYGG